MKFKVVLISVIAICSCAFISCKNLVSKTSDQASFECEHFSIEIKDGFLKKWVANETGVDYFPSDEIAPILSIKSNGNVYQPK